MTMMGTSLVTNYFALVEQPVSPLLGHGTRYLVRRGGWFFYVVLFGFIYLPVSILLT